MPSNWIERRFSFDFPVTLAPNVIARFRGAPARLEDALRGLSSEQLRTRPEPEKWSIRENAAHLLYEEGLFQTRLGEYLSGAEVLTPAPYKKVDFRDDSRTLDQILCAFRLSRQAQTEQLLRLAPDDFARVAWHARLQVQMRLVDHLLFVAEHDDHHLARIWELRDALRIG